MNAQEIKEYIVENDRYEYILEELGMHSIFTHNSTYITAGFPDGDSRKAMTLYLDSHYIDSYKRNIKDDYGNSDIIALVCFIKQIYFSNAIRWLCDILGLDYYGSMDDDIPLSLQWTNLLIDMNDNIDELEEDIKLKPINENILNTYCNYGNDLFVQDGVSLRTQREFEIGLDVDSQRITIPIRDELATLVGVKGRLFYRNEQNNGDKYIYLERCSKSKILYGLHKTLNYIKSENICIVVESEKSVLVLWDRGIRNVVSASGHNLSKYQVEKITRLGIKEVILCYDQDVNRNDNGSLNRQEYINEANKFMPHIKVSAMVDLDNKILLPKESPVDDIDKYNKLYSERRVLQNGENKNN